LLDDLADKFFESHDEGNERSAVAEYAHYFLGSIIVSDKDGQKFIIDGQQRLTTLTLLLIFLHRGLRDVEQKAQLADLIYYMVVPDQPWLDGIKASRERSDNSSPRPSATA
jgi:uncharacterized protein with ParB-like and HNH nuclease domain